MPFTSPPPTNLLQHLEPLLPLVLVVLSIPIIGELLRPARRRRGRQRHRRETAVPKAQSATVLAPEVDIPTKIGALERARSGHFASKRLFNQSELRIFKLLESEFAASGAALRVMGQTSLRSFIETDPEYVKGGGHFALGDRYSDFVATDAEGNVRFVIEYHGEGHYQNNWEERDEIKAIVFEKAGIPLLVVKAGEDDGRIREKIRSLLGAPTGA